MAFDVWEIKETRKSLFSEVEEEKEEEKDINVVAVMVAKGGVRGREGGKGRKSQPEYLLKFASFLREELCFYFDISAVILDVVPETDFLILFSHSVCVCVCVCGALCPFSLFLLFPP